MTELQLDLGNTALKWRLRNQGNTLQRGRLDNRSIDLVLLNKELPSSIQRVACANVAGKHMQNKVCTWSKQKGIHCFIAQTKTRFQDLVNGYVEPEDMGVDRWLAMIAARQYSRNPICVVDCGSAVTLDLIAANGVHLGGYILPGEQLMIHSLINSTSKINVEPIRVQGESFIPAKNTQEAVGRGVKQLLDRGLRSLLQAYISEGYQLYITGGGGFKIATIMGQPYFADLVFEGLELVNQERVC